MLAPFVQHMVGTLPETMLIGVTALFQWLTHRKVKATRAQLNGALQEAIAQRVAEILAERISCAMAQQQAAKAGQ